MSSYPAYYEKYKVMDNPDSTPQKQEQSEESQSPKRQKGGNFPLKRTFSNRDTPNGIKVEETPSKEQNGGKFSPKKAGFSNYVAPIKSGIKEWRLVVRNLPFSTKKEDVEKFFSKLGNVKEVTLPPNKDKRFPKSCAGFCFVQYASRNAADQAISTLNFTDFMGRKIAVDWALDKDSYITKVVESKPPKQSLEIKPTQNPKASKKVVKKELKEDENEDLSSEESENESDSDEISVDEEQESMNSPPAKKGKFPDKNQAKQRPGDLAVQEGRAIFIRNLGFDVTDEEISKEFSKFGEIALAITCKFPHTDHPTGTAFVHFKEKEAADKCLDQLNSIDGIIVEDRKVYGYRAVSREDASVFKKSQEKHPKDKRNLKLLRVSLIRPGTSQANNMSELDATKRQKLATSAKIKLKNLHMFVSPTRLVVHNVPPSMKEQKLREICFLAADHVDGKITECRIMRERKDKSPDGKLILGKSKGFAFVEFAEHNDALKCLQAINNNPTLFSDQKRPIVEFSIENMQALQIKERRVQKPVTPNAKNLADVEQTKSQITAQKPLPKKFGVKIRHRDSKKGQSSQGNQKKKDKMKGKNKNVYINKGQKKKKAKKSRE